MSARSVLATSLIACYAAACAGSLWSRADAIWVIAAASIATVWFIFPGIAKRVLIGAFISLAAVGLGIVLPIIGDLVDAVAALIALALMFDKFRRFAVRIPFGLACFGMYAILWSAARDLPRAYHLVGVHHSVWFDVAAVLAAAVAGLLYLLIICGIASLFSVSPAAAVIYTVGYPWYLILFTLTFFVPDAGDSLSDAQ